MEALSQALATAAHGAYQYCERSSDSVFAEPVNTLSNIPFVLAAWFAARHARRLVGGTLPTPLRVLIALLAGIGVGSFVFHAFSGWTVVLDVVPIGVFVLAFFVIACHFFFHTSWGRAMLIVPAFALVAGATMPALGFLGVYLTAWATLAAFAAALLTRADSILRAHGRGMAGIAALFGVSLLFRQLDQPLCDNFSLGTHFGWHLNNAVMLCLAILLLATRHRERAVPSGSASAAPEGRDSASVRAEP